MPREIYPKLAPITAPPSKAVEELAKEGIEVVSLEPFVVYLRHDIAGEFPTEAQLREYVMKKLKTII